MLEQADASANLLVLGEAGLPFSEGDPLDDWPDESIRQAVEAGTVEIVTETQLWQRLGLAGGGPDLHRLYTPAMLAELLGVSLAVIRRWHRRGLIVPACEVRRLPYFDFQEVATAQRLAQLLSAGVSPRAMEKKLAGLARWLPGIDRPLAQLSVIVQGKDILLRQGDGLIEPGGQFRFDFEAAEGLPAERRFARRRRNPARRGRRRVASGLGGSRCAAWPPSWRKRASCPPPRRCIGRPWPPPAPAPKSASSWPNCSTALGDLPAARERYYMAVELDEDYVEARANLGCVLAETGQRELAVAAFEGALRYHAGYADAHYHLARTLDDMGRRGEAEEHWRLFLAMAPDSPWAAAARTRLGQ